jgi:hypothetical protein
VGHRRARCGRGGQRGDGHSAAAQAIQGSVGMTVATATQLWHLSATSRR